MPQPRGQTASLESVRRLADHALSVADGVTVFFRLQQHVTLEACATRARSFQTTFSSLRAKERRSKVIHALGKGEGGDLERDLYTRGKYDSLGCQRNPLPDGEGWKVELIPLDAMIDAFDVIDNSTGLSLAHMGMHKSELGALNAKVAKALMQGVGYECLTIAERRRAIELDPFFFTQFDAALGRMPNAPDEMPKGFFGEGT